MLWEFSEICWRHFFFKYPIIVRVIWIHFSILTSDNLQYEEAIIFSNNSVEKILHLKLNNMSVFIPTNYIYSSLVHSKHTHWWFVEGDNTTCYFPEKNYNKEIKSKYEAKSWKVFQCKLFSGTGKLNQNYYFYNLLKDIFYSQNNTQKHL